MTCEEIDGICLEYGIQDYSINPDGSIDVNGNVSLSGKGLTKIPLKFNKVDGYFIVSGNNLISLEGSPNHVSMSFYCEGCELTSLKHCPKYIGGNLYCEENKLLTNYIDDIDLVGSLYTSLEEDGLDILFSNATNYKEWLVKKKNEKKLINRSIIIEKVSLYLKN